MTLSDRRVTFTRDSVLFVCGLIGILHETVVRDIDRPYLLFVFAGMMGLPIVYRKDEKDQARSNADKTRDSNAD